MPRDFDSPWKETLDLMLEPFLGFFYSDVHAQIDWSKGYESLDTELQQIIREGELGKSIADRLFLVHDLAGKDIHLLIHIEIQSQYDPDLPERIYVYSDRIWDRYKKDLVSLVILGDENTNWNPSRYERNKLGCQTL